ncbi:MAG TPA: septal ring lytic transglycosylase RlpA family protein [Candidatus Hydrogenedentes bacterium]|nr:septal ring lytic transglycosylase RlpA family protein [Candidatus Hydrogenedentota bacterium]HQE81770.1 septal ring lytic transglycosylase RlpA family protein [Candidatus Hydrogenedentota bacterium]HQH66819.1 septal ring lytic transglycosylase RlpA family protein [Candidatus Hydrogenedentota bacterium]HQM50323.1 septal ring lytic transglycosylase RlpA family protein [Candidatus Hydrogenedentota bacterium]
MWPFGGSVPGVEEGIASWYGDEYHGRATASGEIFDQEAMTAAHRELPFGTIVQVTNLKNHRTVVVRINDRGPFIRGRVIDLSRGAARELNMLRDGIVPVRLEVLEWGTGARL